MTAHTPITPAIRHDGWTQARVAQFLDHLANHGSVTAACVRVGMSREAAYRFRRRFGAFARAWNAALVLAREVSAEVLETRAIHGVEEEVWHRGEKVGTRRKYDARLLLAHMARLDKIADDTRASADATRFDELVALCCGESPPEALFGDGDGLPLPCDEAARLAGTMARQELHMTWVEGAEARAEKLDRLALSPEQRIDAEVAEEVEHGTDCDEAMIRGGRAASQSWHLWRTQAFASVDRLLDAEGPGAEDATLSDSSTSPAGPALEAAAAETPDGVTVVPQVSPSPEDGPAEAPAAPADGKPEREPRFTDFARSPTPWPDYCAARKAFHQKQLAKRAASKG
jgi:hypothetical protein